MPGVLDEQPEARVAGAEKARREGVAETRGLWAMVRALIFIPSELGAMGRF